MSNSYEKACHLINRGIFIKITRRRNKKLSSDLLERRFESSQAWVYIWLLTRKFLLEYFSKDHRLENSGFFFVCFRPIVRMHAAGQWLSWRQNDSVGRLLGVWSLLRHVDSWKRWSQKGWPRRMGQDWCARRRKRSSSGCCPCGPRVHPSSRLVRARVKLFLHRTCLIHFVKVSDRGTNVWLLTFFF